MEFEHLGVFVKTLEQGRDMLKAIFPIAAISDPIHDPLLRVSVQFLSDTSGIRYELVAPNGPGNPVDAVISEQRNTLNHVAYRAKDFDAQVGRLREARCMPLGEPRPAAAFGGARELFFLTPLSMIVELIESAPDVDGTGRARWIRPCRSRQGHDGKDGLRRERYEPCGPSLAMPEVQAAVQRQRPQPFGKPG